MLNSTINTFLQSRIVDKEPSQTPKEPGAIVREVIPFKDQESANYVKKELKNLSIEVQTTVQPVFAKLARIVSTRNQATDRQLTDLCDAGYVGYLRGHLHTRVDRHKQKHLQYINTREFKITTTTTATATSLKQKV